MRAHALIAIGFLAAGTSAQAGPPFATDDPEPVAFQHWEVYLGSQYEHTSEGANGTLPHLELNYGALPNLQLHLIAPAAFDSPIGANRQFGYGDTELGAKYRFFDEEDGRPQVGVFPLVELPTGSSARELGSGHTQVFLPVWLQKKFGTWTTYGGGGRWINPGAGNRNWWFTGWLIQTEVSPGVTVGAEVFRETSRGNGVDSDTKINVGVVWDLDESRHILASAGPTIQGPTGYQAYLALQFTFGPGK